ncbi:IS3 family transposase [Streptomyces sp. NPDC048362]|uniref:IS3 family transposase n=1 Tax=Streptomyces sp. NPDC048362 TaxID=3365539 RepID=UPI003713C1EE
MRAPAPPTTPGGRRSRPPGHRAADDALAHDMTVTPIASRKTYGVPRIHAELRRPGRPVNRKRTARIMREAVIQGVTRRKRGSLTRTDKKSDPPKKARPARPGPDRSRLPRAENPGTRLVGDISYLPTVAGRLQSGLLAECGHREVIGYAMADSARRYRKCVSKPARTRASGNAVVAFRAAYHPSLFRGDPAASRPSVDSCGISY